jgi:hypothetical protein
MLEQVDPQVMAWNACGNGFHIYDMESFTTKVLLEYFRHQKYSSFQRQLNLYGFRKVCKGPDVGAYAHDHFQRDAPALLPSVRRVPQSHKHYRTARFGARRPARTHGSGGPSGASNFHLSGRAPSPSAGEGLECEETKGDEDFENLIGDDAPLATRAVAVGNVVPPFVPSFAPRALGGSFGVAGGPVVRYQHGTALAVPVVDELSNGLGGLALGKAKAAFGWAPAAAPLKGKPGNMAARLRQKIPSVPARLPELSTELSVDASSAQSCLPSDEPSGVPYSEDSQSGLLFELEPLTPGSPGGLTPHLSAAAAVAGGVFFPEDVTEGASSGELALEQPALAPSVSEMLAPLEAACKLSRLTSANWPMDPTVGCTFSSAVFADAGDAAPPRPLFMER